MADLKTGAKFIEKDPPLADQETKSIGRKILDYLAYLKEQLNFIFSNYGRRLTDADGNINELERTADQLTSTIYNPETGLISQIQQNANAISAEVTRATGKEGDLNTAIGVNSAAIAVNAQAITTKVSTTDYNGNEIVSKINQTATTVDISADKINLNGAVTANNNVKILTNGTIQAVNADISGKLTMTDGSINVTTASSFDNVISLNYTTPENKTYEVELSPVHVTGDFNSQDKFTIQPGEIYLEDRSQSTTSQGAVSIDARYGQIVLEKGASMLTDPTTPYMCLAPKISGDAIYLHNGSQKYSFLVSTSSTGAGSVTLGDGTSTVSRAKLSNDSLTFRNSSGTQTAYYPASLTSSRALVTGSSGAVTTSSVTSTELGYLSGVTSNIQQQINNISISPTHLYTGGTYSSATTSYKYTGYYVTIPAGKCFVMTVHAYYSTVEPECVCASNSSTTLATGSIQFEYNTDSLGTRARGTFGGYADTALTYYLWVKGRGSGAVGVSFDGFYL